MAGNEITVEVVGGELFVTSGYNHAFRSGALDLHGHWDCDHEAWVFDPRHEQRVRDLLIEVFGTDGSAVAETVTARVHIGRWATEREVVLFGRTLARRWQRNSRPALGNGVVLHQGGFPYRGGSVKNPWLEPDEGTILEVTDVPAGHRDLQLGCVTIVDTAIDRDALAEEKARLVARLAEIDALLGDAR